MKQFKTESQKVLDLMINSIYTNKEIFLRELISNGSDAIDKLYYKALTDNITGLSRNDFYIEIKADKAARTLTISDNGIGMTADELENNLGTIAKSGSLDFKKDENVKNDDINIIGQFGVGFYSGFMVADKIEVISKKYGEDTANKWVSSGAEGYDLTPCDKETNGTDVILHLKPNADGDNYDSYLEEYTIRNLVKKYSDYVRYPIKTLVTKYKKEDGADKETEYTEEETLNSMVPVWKKGKQELKDGELNEFYKDTFYDMDDPLKTISMSVEGAVDFKALLFIPAKTPYNYYSKNYEKGLKLYTNGVMIMEKCAELLPDYFSFVKGVVDSELVLNISRETVQQSRQLKAIAQSIEKKVKAELLEMQKNDRASYEKFFDAFGLQLKYGIYQSYGINKETLQDLLLFNSAKQGKKITLKEYVEGLAEGDGIYYASGKTIDAVKALPQTEKYLDDGKDVLCFIDEVDEFAVKFMGEYDKHAFKNITQEDIKNEDSSSDEEKEVFAFIKDALNGKVSKVVGTTNLKNHPVCLSSEGDVSIEMERVLNAMPNGENAVKAQKVLEINLYHKITEKLKDLYKNDKDTLKTYAEILYAEAALIAGLNIENASDVSDKIFDILAK